MSYESNTVSALSGDAGPTGPAHPPPHPCGVVPVVGDREGSRGTVPRRAASPSSPLARAGTGRSSPRPTPAPPVRAWFPACPWPTGARSCQTWSSAPPTPDGDARALERLARWADRFTPRVMPDGVDTLFLDIGGCARLFGGEDILAASLRAALEGFGLTVQLALADTPGAAWALAHYSAEDPAVVPSGAGRSELKEALAELPVAALRLSANVADALASFGLDRICTLSVMESVKVTERFGPEPVRRLEQALGLRKEPIAPLRPRLLREVRRAFAEPISATEDIHAAVDGLLDDLCLDLSRAGEGCASAAPRLPPGRRRTGDRHDRHQPSPAPQDAAHGPSSPTSSTRSNPASASMKSCWPAMWSRPSTRCRPTGTPTPGRTATPVTTRSWPACSTGWGTASASAGSGVRCHARAGCRSGRCRAAEIRQRAGRRSAGGRCGCCHRRSRWRLGVPTPRSGAPTPRPLISATAGGCTGYERPKAPSGWSANGGGKMHRLATTTWPKTRRGCRYWLFREGTRGSGTVVRWFLHGVFA